MKDVYTTGEAAAICRISINAIIRCYDNGLLKGFRVPGSKFRRVLGTSLKQFMTDNNLPLEWMHEAGQAKKKKHRNRKASAES